MQNSSLELHHTVHDILHVASAPDFTPLRAFMHRGDTTNVSLSLAVKLFDASKGCLHDRILVTTNNALLLVTCGSKALFGPSAGGVTLPWAQFERFARVDGSCMAVVVFRGAVVRIVFENVSALSACESAVVSITGSEPSTLQQSEMGLLRPSGERRGPVEPTASGAPSSYNPSPEPAAHLPAPQQHVAASSPEVAMSRSPPQSHSRPHAVSDGPSPTGHAVDHMLRYVMGDASPVSAVKSAAATRDAAVQSDAAVPKVATVQTDAPKTRDRASSPIKFPTPSRSQSRDLAQLQTPPQSEFPDDLGDSIASQPSTATEDDFHNFGTSILDSVQRGWQDTAHNSQAPRINQSFDQPPRQVGRDKALASRSRSVSLPAKNQPPTRQAHDMSFEEFLGTLEEYADGLRGIGIGSPSELLQVIGESGDEARSLEQVMDEVGVTKPMHRVLMRSKVSVMKSM